VTRPYRAGVEASTPSWGVLPAVDVVAGVAVAGMPVRVVESLPCGSLSDTVVHRGCLRIIRCGCLSLPSWWSVVLHAPWARAWCCQASPWKYKRSICCGAAHVACRLVRDEFARWGGTRVE
jgi:hypothetical protein